MTPAAMLAQIEAWARELGFQQIGVSALDTGERDPELEAELDRVDDEVGAKIEEDEEDR